jgi:hypothetical protein
MHKIEMKFEGRRLIEFLNYDGKGIPWLRGTLYDEEGKIKENATYHSDGSLLPTTMRSLLFKAS